MNRWKFNAPTAPELFDMAMEKLNLCGDRCMKERCVQSINAHGIRAEKALVSAEIRDRLVDMTKDIIICDMFSNKTLKRSAS